MRRTRLFLVASLVLLALVCGRAATDARAGAAPVVHDRVLATIVGGPLTVSGSALGESGTSRALTFEYEGTSTTVDASSAHVQSWSPTEITITLPTDVRSGTMHVSVDGASSASVDVLVYMYSRVPVPGSPEANSLPLTLDVDAAGRVWLIEEFNSALKSLTPTIPVTGSSLPIPQASAGIFAQQLFGDTPTTVSGWGEDVDVGADGSIWFTQGGDPLYDGVHPNASRIVRYDPNFGEFSCYTSPVDNSEVFGLVVDDARGLVWYAESGFVVGNAISAFDPETLASDCDEMPSETPATVCPGAVQPGCHARHVITPLARNPAQLVLDDAGDIWCTEFWGNSVSRLDPETGAFLRVPLEAPTVSAGDGLWVGSGPWELAWGPDDKLWVTEFFDAAIIRIDTALADGGDCSQLTASGKNLCVESVAVFSDGFDLRSLHSLAPGSGGRVWFGVSGAPAQIGFVSTQDDDAIVLLTLPLHGPGLGGIVEDPATGDIWFTQFEDKSIGRLQIATGDADGIPDVEDNCPLSYNPLQENNDRDFVSLSVYGKPFNDVTWPMSDVPGDACDGDADNDGLSNETEASPAPGGCPSASAALDPLNRDSDGDLALDGSECALASDPADAGSRPSRAPLGDVDGDFLPSLFEILIGTNPIARDSDGDGLHDGIEFTYYGSSPLLLDSDGDGCRDRTESASVNADRTVNSLDLLSIALSYGGSSSPRYVPHFDVNRDGAINPADIGMTAAGYGGC